MSKDKKRLVPVRRFKEFENADAWEQRKLGDQMYIKARIGWQALKKDEYMEIGDFYLITGTDIDESRHIVDLSRCFYVSEERYDMDKKIQLQNGDIIVTKDGTIGKVAMVTDLDKPATLNSHLFVLRDLSGHLDKYFLLTILSSDIFKSFVESTKTGSTLTGLPQKTIVKFKFQIPSIQEQRKISTLFKSVDSLIALHQRKLDKLKRVKSAYLTEMFPAEGEREPKRRFPGFTGAWEQRKLGEVVERFDNLRIPVTSSKREKGITPYYGANGIQDYVQGYTHDGEFVLVAEDGANDLQNYPVHYVNGKVWVNNHAHVLQGKNKMVDNLFLVNAIKQIKIETYLVGGSRAKLNADVMMKLPIKVPTFNEQQKIGEYFSKFDTLITLHQRKLDKLQKLKNAYLNEMFV